MNAFAELRGATLGWLDLISARTPAAGAFNSTRRGLANAVGFYFAVVLLGMVIDAIDFGVPDLGFALVRLVVEGLPLLALGLVTVGTQRLMLPQLARWALLVPMVYALGFRAVLAIPLTVWLGAQVVAPLLGAFGYLAYRAARIVGKLNIGVAIAFAFLSVLALVLPGLGLYMLLNPAGSPI